MGISPMNISCSLISPVSFMTNRVLTYRGCEKVISRSLLSCGEYLEGRK